MKPILVAVSLGVLLVLTACGTRRHHVDNVHVMTSPAACKVDVHVHKDRLYIDQEPVYAKRCRPGDPVLFFLKGGGNNATLSVAITGGPRPRPSCQSIGQKEFSCTLDPTTASGAEFKYEVEVTRGTETYKKLDPMIIND